MEVLNKKLLRRSNIQVYPRVIAKLTVSLSRGGKREGGKKNKKKKTRQQREMGRMRRRSGYNCNEHYAKEKREKNGNNFVGDIQGHHHPARV